MKSTGFREYYYADHMNAILGVYTTLDEFTDLQCDYVDQVVKRERLEKELPKSNTTPKSFEALQQHAINLELALQKCGGVWRDEDDGSSVVWCSVEVMHDGDDGIRMKGEGDEWHGSDDFGGGIDAMMVAGWGEAGDAQQDTTESRRKMFFRWLKSLAVPEFDKESICL
ncbi:hypothetical protein Tco_1199142 [Tanacetum coccineum]